jgi:hypothetical protein
MISNEEYVRRINLIEDLVSFHPEYLAQLDQQSQQILSGYYFADRDIDIDSVADYRRQLLQERPGLDVEAEAAWAQFCKVAGLDVPNGSKHPGSSSSLGFFRLK